MPVIFILLVIAAIILGPLGTIWALNTLFPVLNIAYTWETWLAVIIVGAAIRSDVTVKKG